uniref:Uncharacterized protein n=1 Tax=Ixodes ricinus TaxID=34613 RepID=A0A6B0TWI0_IXORI
MHYCVVCFLCGNRGSSKSLLCFFLHSSSCVSVWVWLCVETLPSTSFDTTDQHHFGAASACFEPARFQ